MLYLQELARQGQQKKIVSLYERLPTFLKSSRLPDGLQDQTMDQDPLIHPEGTFSRREEEGGNLEGPCNLEVTYQVEAKEDFYLIHLHVQGELHLQCQRCLDEFNFHYDNHTELAVCRYDERANQLLEQYECIVSAHLQVDLEEVLTDELHLYAPQYHPQMSECSGEINQFL